MGMARVSTIAGVCLVTGAVVLGPLTSIAQSPSAGVATTTVAPSESTVPASSAPAETMPVAPTSGEFTEGTCPVETDPGVTITCGTVAVPLDHADPAAGTIGIAVAILPAADPSAGGTPIILLGGGPGEHTVAPLVQSLTPEVPFFQLAATRDVVIIDQRGVGASVPALECPEFAEALAQITDTAQIAATATDAVTACRARLAEEGVDPSAFDTAADVDDLDVVRSALGYDRVSLFGTSYGARLALQAAREYPDTIESVALSSPIPAEENFVTDAGDSFDRAIAALGEACAADSACNATYPDVVGTLQGLIQQFDAEPATVEVTDPASGTVVPIPVDGALLATLLFGLFYVPDGPSSVPYFVTSIAAGDLSSVTALLSQPALATVSQGQQLSFLCAEEATVAEREDMTTGDLGVAARVIETNPIVGTTLWDLCAVWDVEPAAAETFEAVVTDVPLLVVTGQFDQITPPDYGVAVADAATTAWYVEVAGVGHSPLFAAGECGVAVLGAFVADPTREPDLACFPTEPTFATPEEIADSAEEASAATSVPG